MANTSKNNRFNFFSGLGRTLFVSLLIFSLLPLTIVGVLSYKNGKASLLEKEIKSLQAAVNLRTLYLGAYFKERIKDLILHADFSENILLMQKLQDAFIESGIPLKNFLQSYSYISIVTEHGADIQEFQELSESYNDVLLIDPQGNILHSVAASPNLGTNIYSGPYRDSELAKVAKKTIELGKTLCSDLSIDTSSGDVESLFATQVMVDEAGDMIGIMVIQMTMNEINGIMNDPSGLGQTGQTYLVGNDGTLRSQLRYGEASFVLGDKINNQLVIEWLKREKLRHAPGITYKQQQQLPVLSKTTYFSGQSNQETLAISHDIDSLGIYDIHWIMIAEIDVAEAFSASKKLGKILIYILTITAVLVLLLGAFITRRMILPLSNITAWSKQVAMGDLSLQAIKTQDNEIGALYKAVTEMVSSLKNMMSHKDLQDWFQSGETGLNNAMQGIQDPAEMAQNVLNFVCSYLNLQVGAFFLKEENLFIYAAGYAYKTNNPGSLKFSLGEGLLGQAALEKKLIIFDDIPKDHFDFKIDTGLGISLPKSVLFLPLLQEQQLIGVLELGAARKFNQQEIQFLNNIIPIVAINIKTALASTSVQSLLVETQRQGQELEQRQIELKDFNDELQEKTRFLEKQRLELTSAKQDIELKARDLEQASIYKTEFLANMSHELRSPLNSLLILAQSLAENDEGNLTAVQAKEAGIIHSSGQDLLNLINDILDLSKVEAGQIDLHYDTVIFSELAQDLKNQFLPIARRQEILLKIHIDPDLAPSMIIDEQRLKQILKNLLSNSFKFTHDGMVELSILPVSASTLFYQSELIAENTIAFQVTDTGIGIPKEKQSDIFEAFQQGDGSTSRKYGGTGLGLNISRQFSKLMGGEIHLKSQQDKGTVFTLYLPAKISNTSAHSKVTLEASQPSITRHTAADPINETVFHQEIREQLNSNDKSLLIIEDDRNFSNTLSKMAEQKGFKVLTTSHGSTGVQLAAEHHPKAIILDLSLPDIDGSVVMDKLKHKSTKDIPVHVISARDKSAEIMNKGAVTYLNKPVEKTDLDNLLDNINTKGHVVKKILIVESDSESRDAIINLIDHQTIEITAMNRCSEVLNSITDVSFDCMIFDLEQLDKNCFEILDKLKKKMDFYQPTVVIYSNRNVSEEERLKLQQYISSVTINMVNTTEQVIEEVANFLQSIETSNNDKQGMDITAGDFKDVFNNKKILVVDDDMRNTFAIAGMLKKSGMQAELASSGKQALEQLTKHSDIDLVLLDIMMPKMDGYETIRQIRSYQHFSELPVIALTAKAMHGDRQQCLDEGFSDYLSKPVNKDKLYSLMSDWLNK